MIHFVFWAEAKVWLLVKQLLLGLLLITLASSVLLLSDMGHRKARPLDTPRVALLQFASQAAIDESVKGILDGLAEVGFSDGGGISIQHYNAEGETSTLNLIAQEIVGGAFDLIVTSTTLAMQAVANANQEGRVRHVFGLVADPAGAGVGINREDPLDHPRHLVGLGNMVPVEETFRQARGLLPSLRKVGVVWNPAEANSEQNTEMAREICQELGIELLESNVTNSSEVFEAAGALASRGVEAFWVGADAIVIGALDSVVGVARKQRVPVFTSISGSVERGALFDLGVDYHEIGRQTGVLAGKVLEGIDPAAIPVRNVHTSKLLINTTALEGLRDGWKLPDDVLARADVVIDKTGIHDRSLAGAVTSTSNGRPRPLSKTWKVNLLKFVEIEESEEAEKGVLVGLEEAGLVKARDYEVKGLSAHGDMATVTALVDASVTEGADLLITLSTPTLQAALSRGRSLPVVFTFVADPIVAGAGRSDEDHLPHVTGVYLHGAYEEVIATVRECLPSVQAVGTLFVPAEVNTVYHKDMVVKAAKAAGIEVVAVPVTSPTEIADAALSLCSRKIDALCQIGGNLLGSSFTSIARAARQARLPVFGFMSTQAHQGAVVAVARDYYEGGREAGHLAARVMRGEDPADLPFRPVQSTRIIVNLKAARQNNLTLPPTLIQRADEILDQ